MAIKQKRWNYNTHLVSKKKKEENYHRGKKNKEKDPKREISLQMKTRDGAPNVRCKSITVSFTRPYTCVYTIIFFLLLRFPKHFKWKLISKSNKCLRCGSYTHRDPQKRFSLYYWSLYSPFEYCAESGSISIHSVILNRLDGWMRNIRRVIFMKTKIMIIFQNEKYNIIIK